MLHFCRGKFLQEVVGKSKLNLNWIHNSWFNLTLSQVGNFDGSIYGWAKALNMINKTDSLL